MLRVDQMEIFRNKWTTFGGISLFPFQPDETEITVQFAQNFHFYCSRLHQFLTSLSPAWKQKCPSVTRKIFGISDRKFGLNGKRPGSTRDCPLDVIVVVTFPIFTIRIKEGRDSGRVVRGADLGVQIVGHAWSASH